MYFKGKIAEANMFATYPEEETLLIKVPVLKRVIL